MEFLKNIIEYMDYATIIFAFFAMFFSAWNFYKNKKQSNAINIILEKNNKTIKLPIQLIRKNVSRGEILGILGNLDKDSKFEIAYTANKEFFDQIIDVSQCKRDDIKIILTDNDKFNWSGLDELL